MTCHCFVCDCLRGFTLRSCSRRPGNHEMLSLRKAPRELYRQLVIELLDQYQAASFIQNCYEKEIPLCELHFSIT